MSQNDYNGFMSQDVPAYQAAGDNSARLYRVGDGFTRLTDVDGNVYDSFEAFHAGRPMADPEPSPLHDLWREFCSPSPDR
jgi:hypothetical protein